MTDLLVGLAFTIGTFFILMILYFVYYFQDQRTGIRADLYRYSIIINAVLIISELISSYLLYDKLSPTLGEILLKFHWYTGIAYFYFFYFYSSTHAEGITDITKKELFWKRKEGKIITIITIIFSIVFIIIPFKDLDYHALSYLPGLPAYTVFAYAIIIVMVLFIKYLKKKNKSRHELLFMLIFVFVPTLDLILQLIWLNIAFSPTFMAFILMGCYFLLENPDVYTAKELNEVKNKLEITSTHKKTVITQKCKWIQDDIQKIAQTNYAILNVDDKEKAKMVINRNTYKLKDIINETQCILDMLILSENNSRIDANEYYTANMLTKLYNYAIKKIGDNKVNLTFEIDPFLPIKLYGYETMVYRILLNSIDCAINNTTSGAITLKLRCSFSTDNVLLIVDIVDTGNVITDNDVNIINNDNVPIENMKTVELYRITKQLVSYINGSYNVTLNLKQGSTISINFYQRIVDSAKIQEFKPVEINYAINKGDRKLLIVDNNPQTLLKALRNYNLNYDIVASLEECLNKLKVDDSFTTIFINQDIINYDGNIVNAVKNLMGNHPNITNKVIAVSANSISGIKTIYLSKGFDFFINKPFDEYDLHDILTNI